MTVRSVILGAGCYLPSRRVTNEELAKTVDTSDEWIVQRTGIRERHIAAAGNREPESCVHFDPDHVTARREPDLPPAGEQHLPGFMLLAADQGVLAVGAALSIGSGFPLGAGEAVVAAGSAVFGPSARLEVPAAEGPDPFFAAFSSTWRSVNS